MARRFPKRGFMPGDLIVTNGGQVGFVVTARPHPLCESDDDAPEWEWKVIIDSRLKTVIDHWEFTRVQAVT